MNVIINDDTVPGRTRLYGGIKRVVVKDGVLHLTENGGDRVSILIDDLDEVDIDNESGIA